MRTRFHKLTASRVALAALALALTVGGAESGAQAQTFNLDSAGNLFGTAGGGTDGGGTVFEITP